MNIDAKTYRWRATALVVLACVAAACGDDPTGPARTPSDVERANEDFAVVRAKLLANLDVATDLSYVTPVLDTLGVPLPADLLGDTFEWDTTASGYLATARSGAPASGLRFLLYDRDVTPPGEVGFVDIASASDSVPTALGVHLEKDGITRLDYLIDAGASGSSDITAAGFVTGGTEQVDFAVAQQVRPTSEGARLDLVHSLAMADRPLMVQLQYSLNLSLFTPDATFVATFIDGPGTLVIDLTQDAQNTIDGTVTWNDEIVMTITGDGNGEPVFLGPEGEDLDPADARAIRSLYQFASDGVGYLLPYLIIPDESPPLPGGTGVALRRPVTVR